MSTVYVSLATCGVIAFLGSPSPTLERQGGVVVTPVWASLCIVAGCVGLVSIWRHSKTGEILGALLGASAVAAWTASLILQGVRAGTWNTASAACMGMAFTALLIYRARRIVLGGP